MDACGQGERGSSFAELCGRHKRMVSINISEQDYCFTITYAHWKIFGMPPLLLLAPLLVDVNYRQ